MENGERVASGKASSTGLSSKPDALTERAEQMLLPPAALNAHQLFKDQGIGRHAHVHLACFCCSNGWIISTHDYRPIIAGPAEPAESQ